MKRVGKWCAGVFVVGTFGFWVWAFTPWARSENPARLDDRSFVAWAEQRCAEMTTEIEVLSSPRDAETLEARAAQVDSGTEYVEGWVSDLRGRAAGLAETTDSDGPADAQLVGDWIVDWEQYLDDRRAHSVKLRAATPDTPDRELAFLLSDVVAGGIYTERMDGFARLNNMDSCQVPGDV